MIFGTGRARPATVGKRSGTTLIPGLTLTLTLALSGATSALAATSESANWAGYAVHRSGTRFTRVLGSWRQPTPRCVAGSQTFSAMWVGLGGFAARSAALEQIGTESDCTADGTGVSSAWYELLPAASHTIRMRVKAGDLMSAGVTVSGHRVRMWLTDRSAHHSFSRAVTARRVDISSAEWILEAPSDCPGSGPCQTLPLTNFGSAAFGLASVRTSAGRVGAIASRAWDTTRIYLVANPSRGSQQYVRYDGTSLASGTASPTALQQSGSGFGLTFGAEPASGPIGVARTARIRVGALVHPRR